MNKKNAIIFLAALISMLNACQNPFQDIKLGFKDPIETGVVEVRFRSLKGALPKAPALKITGPDADEIVTTLNTTNYKVNSDGVLVLAASPESNYSKTDPLRFNVAAQADGYLTIIQPILLSDTGRQTVSPAWINLNDPPPHLSALQTQVTSSEGTTISTPMLNQKKDRLTIRIEPGTEFRDASGNRLTGPLTAGLVHVESRGNSLAPHLPNGSVLTAVTGLQNEALGSLQLGSTAGLFSLELYDKDFRIAGQIAKPVACTMTLNPETVHPIRNRPIQAGDEIPLYRYDRFTGRWYQEKPVVVSAGASTGQLECKLAISQSALWVTGWTGAVCDLGPVFSISSPLRQVDIRYLCKVVQADTRQEIRSFYTSLNDGEQIALTYLPQNQKVRLQLYNYNDAYSTGNPGNPLLETAPLETCNQTPQRLDLQRWPVPPAITVRFDFVCPPPTRLNESLLPNKIRLQYSEAGQRQWRDLVILNRTAPRALSYKLQIRRLYDIRVSTDGGASWPLEKNGFEPNNNTLAFEVASPEFCK